jgi:glycerol-1-phosphatase
LRARELLERYNCAQQLHSETQARLNAIPKPSDPKPSDVRPVGTEPIDSSWICQRYESVRSRVPAANFTPTIQQAEGLLAIADNFDAFLLDAFGVLNVGLSVIPRAPDVVAELQRAGKAVFVLTNGATAPAREVLAKYRRWGYDFDEQDVIASRDLIAAGLAEWPASMVWGVVGPESALIEELATKTVRLHENAGDYARVDGFVFLSTSDWNDDRQQLLHDALLRAPRPLLVANPDIAAPCEVGFSLEPGHYGHFLADIDGIDVRFYGKPFANAFDEAMSRLSARGVEVSDRRRVAMVGDSLHTDILGGAAAGCKTVLITGYGLFREADCGPAIRESGIYPDFMLPGV